MRKKVAWTDNLSFLMEQGMPLDEIKRLTDSGLSMEEIAASARRIVDSGRPLVEPGEAVKADLPEFFDGNKFLHNVFGDYLIENYGVCKINGSVHIYDNGVYRAGEDAIHGLMVELLPRLSDSRRREVHKYVRVTRRTPEKTLSPPNLIPFRHRIYDLNTGEFLDYSKEFVFLNRFPYDYCPEAPEAPLITETLNSITNGDAEVLRLLLEAFGNCFYLLNAYRGSVMLYGQSGSNGKSTLLNMLAQMIGRDNSSFLSLQDTAEKFRLFEIYGKAVNIGDDISDAYLRDSSTFKKLVTGENVIAEQKGRDPVSFRPFAKMFFALNALPPISDKSQALFSRILLIPMVADFSSSCKRNAGLKDRVWTEGEMSYLVRLSMEGLKRLISQGDFTRPDCVTRAMLEFEIENNPVLGFLHEYSSVVGEPTEKVYQDFKGWCSDNGHRNVVTRTKFSREVCFQAGVKTYPMRHPYFDGKLGRCFVE